MRLSMRRKMTPATAIVIASLWIALAIWAIVTTGNLLFALGGVAIAAAFVIVGRRSRY